MRKICPGTRRFVSQVRTSVIGLVIASIGATGCSILPADVQADDCIVLLHGKGDEGASATIADDVAVLRPDGNGEGWGGREWRYDDAEQLSDAIDVVADAVDDAGCRHAVVHGFSNGGAFAAALVCSGATLGGRLVGVVVDDPVADAATAGCDRPDDVRVSLYWTGALTAIAPAGTDCAPIDWTCAGGTVRGIDDFAADLRAKVRQSPFTEHRWYLDAPEPRQWLSEAD